MVAIPRQRQQSDSAAALRERPRDPLEVVSNSGSHRGNSQDEEHLSVGCRRRLYVGVEFLSLLAAVMEVLPRLWKVSGLPKMKMTRKRKKRKKKERKNMTKSDVLSLSFSFASPLILIPTPMKSQGPARKSVDNSLRERECVRVCVCDDLASGVMYSISVYAARTCLPAEKRLGRKWVASPLTFLYLFLTHSIKLSTSSSHRPGSFKNTIW